MPHTGGTEPRQPQERLATAAVVLPYYLDPGGQHTEIPVLGAHEASRQSEPAHSCQRPRTTARVPSMPRLQATAAVGGPPWIDTGASEAWTALPHRCRTGTLRSHTSVGRCVDARLSDGD